MKCFMIRLSLCPKCKKYTVILGKCYNKDCSYESQEYKDRQKEMKEFEDWFNTKILVVGDQK
jgi:hypothetical protein